MCKHPVHGNVSFMRHEKSGIWIVHRVSMHEKISDPEVPLILMRSAVIAKTKYKTTTLDLHDGSKSGFSKKQESL
jgi:hypothetical protein